LPLLVVAVVLFPQPLQLWVLSRSREQQVPQATHGAQQRQQQQAAVQLGHASSQRGQQV
jgi:hypothetical protein